MNGKQSNKIPAKGKLTGDERRIVCLSCGYDEFRKRTTLVAVTFRIERKLRDMTSCSYLLYKRLVAS
jgi:hypothetical protein